MYNKTFFNDIKIGSKRIRGRFVIPSGIRCTNAQTIEYYFHNIDEIGIITTKSISAKPKEGYQEPLYVRYSDRSYINAVGLSNPGADIFAKELSEIEIPSDKFLLVSIFGKNAEEFLQAAKILEPFADGFELNMSCPHAKGYGLQVGHDVDLVKEITKTVVENVSVPVFVKLSAVIQDLPNVSKIVIQNGATGISVTNTIGPSIEYLSNTPVLSNAKGGLSGEGIRPLGLVSVRDIREEIGDEPIIIGMGGISTPEHVKSFHEAGADFFGVGSALTNLNFEEAKAFFSHLEGELLFEGCKYDYNKNNDNMNYHECTVEENISLTQSLHMIRLSNDVFFDSVNDTAGKFYFLTIPGIGEKPFALFSLQDRQFVIKDIGRFTHVISNLNKGEKIFIRGPYGKELPFYRDYKIVFVGGGTGISPLYEISKKYSDSNSISFFFGGKNSGDIFGIDKFEKIGSVFIATEDGSIGDKGNVVDLLKKHSFNKSDKLIFINCGPKPMIEKCHEFEQGIALEENILVSIEYHTSCGVGICGKCSTESGLLLCVDGPFFTVNNALKIKTCNHN